MCHLDICFFHFKTIVYLTNSAFNNKNIYYALRNLKIHIFRVGPTAYLSMLSMIQIVFVILFCYPCYVYFSPYICQTMHARWLQKFQAYAPVHRKSGGVGGSGGTGAVGAVAACSLLCLFIRKKSFAKVPHKSSPLGSLLWIMPPLAQEQLANGANLNDWLPWNTHILSLEAESIAKPDKLGFS